MLKHTLVLVGLTLSFSLNAATIFSLGNVVSNADHSATFDTLTANYIDLSTYSEDSISITALNYSYVGFSAFSPIDSRTTGFYYSSGGDASYVTIKLEDGTEFSSIEFLLGDGFSKETTNLRWESFLDGVLVSSGLKLNVEKGSIVGWTDIGGIDELRVAAGYYDPGFGNPQAIAIDDLRLQVASVPVPAASCLFISALLSLLGKKRIACR